MDERNNRLDHALIAHLEREPREGINEVLAHRTPAQVLWDWPRTVQHPVDVWFDDHTRAAGGAGLLLVDLLVSLNHRRENVVIVLEDIEECGLVHGFEQHHSGVYQIGGVDELPH